MDPRSYTLLLDGSSNSYSSQPTIKCTFESVSLVISGIPGVFSGRKGG